MDWTKQGAAVVASVDLKSGQRGNVVLVGARENPKGAVIVLPSGGGAVDTRPLEAHLDNLPAATVTEIMCMQERLFGASGLPKVNLA
jgi:hypothetical protein